MTRIEDQNTDMQILAKKVLSWIIHSKRPLTTLELRHALGVETGKPELDKDNVPETKGILSVCVGLVTVDKKSDIIRLAHYTTQEYFERTRTSWFPNAHRDITTSCVTYLSFNIFRTGFCETDHMFEERLRLNPFYDYAAHNWGHHAAKDMTASQEVVSFLESKAKVEASSQVLMVAREFSSHLDYSQEAPRNITALHLTGYFGVSKAIDALLRLRYSPDLKDTYSRTPLWYAAQNGHDVVVKLLLAVGADVNAAAGDYEWTALQKAALGGHLEVAEKLLAAGADVNAAAGYTGRTALQAAAHGGYLEVVEKLLAAGADVNAAAGYKGTTLQAAAQGGHLEVVEKLLAAGADVNVAAGDFGQTALQAAADGGYLEVIEKLLAAGADVNAAARDYELTTLQEAALGGHLEVVEKLLAAGADVNVAAGDFGQTTLQTAAQGGHLEVIEKLLVAGADVNAAAGHFGRTALEAATRGGHIEVVNLLKATGALR